MKAKAPAPSGPRRRIPRKVRRNLATYAAPQALRVSPPRAVIVLGMHRSGTSAVTRVVSLLGADLPKNLLPPSLTNELGYWESSDLMTIHDELLSSGGSKWDDWRAFNQDWY